MNARSETHGSATSTVEVTNVSKHGFWLLVDGDLALESIEHPERYPLEFRG